MADEEKEEMSLPHENEENPFDAGELPEFEKSPEEIAAEEAMMAAMAEEVAAAAASDAQHVENNPGVAEETLGMMEERPEDAVPDRRPNTNAGNLDLLMDISLQVSVELGRLDMNFGDILNLGRGSVVELNKLADEPVDIYVNHSKIAEGEVVVVDEHFGVRISKLLNSERLKRAG